MTEQIESPAITEALLDIRLVLTPAPQPEPVGA